MHARCVTDEQPACLAVLKDAPPALSSPGQALVQGAQACMEYAPTQTQQRDFTWKRRATWRMHSRPACKGQDGHPQ